MNYVFRPLGSWTEGETELRWSRWSFRAGYEDTLRLLEDELWRLDARNIVLHADFAEGDLRMDGRPRSNARQPVHPGIRVAFDSRHGPLRYSSPDGSVGRLSWDAVVVVLREMECELNPQEVLW